jgi:hypothetical protein
MRTTLDIDNGLLTQAKSLAAREHTSLTRLIEEGLSLRLRPLLASQPGRPCAVLPVHAGRGGLHPAIRNAKSQRAILDALDETDFAR